MQIVKLLLAEANILLIYNARLPLQTENNVYLSVAIYTYIFMKNRGYYNVVNTIRDSSEFVYFELRLKN